MLHLIKLSVGPKDLAELSAIQAERRAGGARLQHLTRMVPRRSAEILPEGSIYWVVAGVLRARQRLLAIEETTRADGTACAALVLDPGLVEVEPRPVKPFQGWRYLPAHEAPRDLPALSSAEGAEALPPEMRRALRELGLL